MKKLLILLTGMAGIIISHGCTDEKTKLKVFGDQIAITWELKGNSLSDRGGEYTAVFTLENKGERELPGENWTLYFNQNCSMPSADESKPITLKYINGDFNRLMPGKSFSLKPGEKMTYEYTAEGIIIKENQAPEGVYFVFNEKSSEPVLVKVNNYKVLPFTDLEKINPIKDGSVAFPTPESIYKENEAVSLIPAGKLDKIIPRPVSYQPGNGEVELSETDHIVYQAGCKNEAEYLRSSLEKLTGVRVDISEGIKEDKNSIVLKTGNITVNGINEEAYELNIQPGNGVVIEGSDPAGVFYGIQSMLALVPLNAYKHRVTTFRLNAATVKDAPRFHYRGLHFDVARNFSKKETVLKLIDLLAFYKLNTLHLHLTDDEGWRIEIPSLPELTEIGSKRAHTLDDAANLTPSYGSGPFADPDHSTGTGYYTQQDFIEILTYANQRHIRIIPEINVPGHSRAAIKSMEARYHRLMKEGKDEAALEYRLADPNDSSIYSSAQAYRDNVICVGLESAYRFYDTVVKDLKAMYDKAGVPFTIIHTGGDEVPRGVWTKSPVCAAILKEHPEIGDPHNLQGYFLKRLVEVLKKYDITMAGWEEVALTMKNKAYVPNPRFIGQKVLPYVWNSLGENLNLGYKLANAGYPIIMCNVNNFYFDLAYTPDPKEPGLYWGGFVNTHKAYDFIPFDVFKSSMWDDIGRPVDPDKAYKGMERLKPEARSNIIGLQAELWSETLKNSGMVEYYTLPKLMGFAERAWSVPPSYETIENTSARVKAVDAVWNMFANVIGQEEFPRLDYLYGGFQYRIAPPGAKVEEGMLYANTDFPGLTIRYTTDGTEPTDHSIVYTEPIKVRGTIKLRAFNATGRSGRISEIMAK